MQVQIGVRSRPSNFDWPGSRNGDHARLFRTDSLCRRRDHKNTMKATDSKVQLLAVTEWEWHDFLIHERHCTSIFTTENTKGNIMLAGLRFFSAAFTPGEP